jgi:hypothetical protein
MSTFAAVPLSLPSSVQTGTILIWFKFHSEPEGFHSLTTASQSFIALSTSLSPLAKLIRRGGRVSVVNVLTLLLVIKFYEEWSVMLGTPLV